jgi:hypothetical protein
MLLAVLKDLVRRRPGRGAAAAPPSTPAPASMTSTPATSVALESTDTQQLAMELQALRRSMQEVNDSVASLWFSFAVWINDFEVMRNPRYADPKRLIRHAFQVTSQNGEDGILHEIFRRIGTTDRVFAEIGVGTGNENNTAFLLSQGWTGYWIDGADRMLSTLASRSDIDRSHVVPAVAFVTRESIGPLFAKLGVPKTFDLLSIDVDQNTYYIWEGLQDYRPRVVVAEYNAALPPDVDWKVRYDPQRTWDGTQNFGASLLAVTKLANARGYQLVGCYFTGLNAFFVRDDLIGDHFAAPFTADNHHEPPRYHLTIRRMHRGAVLDRGT